MPHSLTHISSEVILKKNKKKFALFLFCVDFPQDISSCFPVAGTSGINTSLISQTEKYFKKFCDKHIKYIISLLIMAKIYRNLKNASEDIESIRVNSSKVRKEHRKQNINLILYYFLLN